MSESKPDEIRVPKLRDALAGAAVGSVLIWMWWGVENYSNMRLVRRFQQAHEEPLSVWIPLLSMPVFAVVAWALWRRAYSIAQSGEIISARIVEFGAAMSGLRDVTVEYCYGGKEFRKKFSIDVDAVKTKEIGDELRLVVDTRNPARSYELKS